MLHTNCASYLESKFNNGFYSAEMIISICVKFASEIVSEQPNSMDKSRYFKFENGMNLVIHNPKGMEANTFIGAYYPY